MSKIITATEAARLRGVTQDTVRRWCRNGLLEQARKAGKTWLIDKDELLTLDPNPRGWQAGVRQCPDCDGALTLDHVCPGQGQTYAARDVRNYVLALVTAMDEAQARAMFEQTLDAGQMVDWKDANERVSIVKGD